MAWWQAIILGVIEGITEFLPISSTGHLTIAEKLLGMRIDDPSVVAFTAIIQIGAILAAVIYFWNDIWRILQAWWRGLWYLPPEDISVLMSTYVLKKYDLFKVKGLPKVAQLLDLAVRHYIKIYEVKKSSLFSGAQYEIEIIKDLQELKAEEIEIIQDMFDSPSIPKPGQRLNLKNLQNNIKYMTRTRDDDKNLETLAREKYGLCEQNPEVQRIMRGWLKRVIVLAVLLLSPMFLVMSIILAFASRGWSLTDKGLSLRRYLKGLKMYIGVAEAERLNILQSPEGAEKIVVDVNDGKQLVKLYERVLPYAVLFGQEKNWSKQMGKYYEQVGEAPDWYVGQGAFNAVAFSSGLNGLSTAAGHASDYSSTSGGSSGGGFAGGGGGGGGGGGW